MFEHAIVRKPGRSLIHGLTTAGLGPPDYEKALAQHARYVEALEACGLDVLVLEADEAHPDATFVEDTAILTPACAIITRPGAPSRRGETAAIKRVLEGQYGRVEEVRAPGTVEGGDVMMVGPHCYIGLSDRTNAAGAGQVIAFLEQYGLSGSVVQVDDVLHLKTGVSYLEENTLVAWGAFAGREAFRGFDVLEVDRDEGYAANCVWVNGRVLVPAGYPKAKAAIERAGYATIEVDVSEFRKLDGGLSCLSLRY